MLNIDIGDISERKRTVCWVPHLNLLGQSLMFSRPHPESVGENKWKTPWEASPTWNGRPWTPFGVWNVYLWGPKR